MRLLVIEDERDLCEDIAKKLRLSGYEADTCVDGEAALELLARLIDPTQDGAS